MKDSTMQPDTQHTEVPQRTTVLSESEWERFSQRLLDTPAPRDALRVAAVAYRQNTQPQGDVTVVDGRGWREDLTLHPEAMLDPH